MNLIGCEKEHKKTAFQPKAEDDTSSTKIENIVNTAPSISEPQSIPSKPIFLITSPKTEEELEAGTPIQVSGTYSSLPKDTHIWLFLIDVFGGYYLQNPVVEILSKSQWEQNNVRPGKGIRYIVALQVDKQGHQRVSGWAGVGRWGRIPAEEIKTLPGYEELDRVKVKTPSPD